MSKVWVTMLNAIYAALIRCYPHAFREKYGEEMGLFVQDLLEERQARGYKRAHVEVVKLVLVDAVRTIGREHFDHWRRQMSNNRTHLMLAGMALLATPLAFLAVNTLQYTLSIPLPWNPFDAIYDNAGALPSLLMDMIIVLGPVCAAILFLLSTFDMQLDGAGRSVTLQFVGISRFQIAVLGVTFFTLALFSAYFLGENWACLAGQALSC